MDNSSHVNKVTENAIIWEKRAVLMSAFGLVGLGTLLGAISVSVRYMKHKIAAHFHIHPATISHITAPGLREEKEDHEAASSPDNGSTEGNVPRVSRTNASATSADTDLVPPSSIPSTVTMTGPAYSDLRPDEPPEGQTNTSDELEEFFNKIDDLLRGSTKDQHQAYAVLKSNADKLKDLCDYWWRFARAAHIEAEVAEQQQDSESQKTLLLNAVSYAEKALKLNDKSADAHKWYGISQGSRGQFMKISEKIQNGFLFKKHIDRAVELNPSDASLHHLLGRFCYEVSQLTWVERRVAATLFSDPPTATIQEALNHFLNAEKNGVGSVENRYYIAKCYMNMGDNKKTAYWLNMASQASPDSQADKKCLPTVTQQLGKYRKYL